MSNSRSVPLANVAGIGKSPSRRASRALFGASVGMFFNAGVFMFQILSIMIVPIVQSTGWSQAVVAGAVGPATIVAALLTPAAGYFVDRYGPRRVALVGFPVFAASLVLLGLATTSANGFALVLLVVGVSAAVQMGVPYQRIAVGWFDERRGLAVGLTMAAFGLSVATMIPFAAWLVSQIGWRMTYAWIGAGMVLIGFPLLFSALEDPPRLMADGAPKTGMTVSQGVRTKVFWILVVTFFVMTGEISSMCLHMPSLLVLRGMSQAGAGETMAILGVTIVGARLVTGYLFDRFFAPYVIGVLFLGVLSAAAIIALNVGRPGDLFALTLLGLAYGADAGGLSYLTSRAFGELNFGRIYGLLFIAFGVGTGLTALLVATALRFNYRYEVIFSAMAVVGLLATLPLFAIRRAEMPFYVAKR